MTREQELLSKINELTDRLSAQSKRNDFLLGEIGEIGGLLARCKKRVSEKNAQIDAVQKTNDQLYAKISKLKQQHKQELLEHQTPKVIQYSSKETAAHIKHLESQTRQLTKSLAELQQAYISGI